MNVQAYCTDSGWFFEANGKKIGPFGVKDFESLDFGAKVAAELSIEPKEVVAAKFREFQKPLSLAQLADILSTTIKRDEAAKLITFLGMLLAQTDEDQYNIGFQAESSTGKSYIPLELIEYFPKDERRIYAGASPTSFFHEVGEWDDERKVIRVDLNGKILIFLDQPHWMLMEKLRPLLSHDQKILTYKITDKREKVGLRTKTVEIIGYPTVIFCTTKPTLEDQERTRLWLLSPEVSKEKLMEALSLAAKKEGDRETFREWVERHPMRAWLKNRIEMVRNSQIRGIVVPDEESILERFLARKKHLAPRDQRDFPRLLRLIKGIALLNCFHREKRGDGTIVATKEDVEEGFRLYEMVAKSNELGLSPEIYELYEEVIKPLLESKADKGLDKKEIQAAYRRRYYRLLSFRRLRDEILPSLEAAGLVTQEPDPTDKRRMLVYPTDLRDISQDHSVPDEKCVPGNSGVVSTLFSEDEAVYPTDLRGISQDQYAWRPLRPGLEYRRIHPGEPCKECTLSPTEYEVRGSCIEGVSRLCGACLRKLLKDLGREG